MSDIFDFIDSMDAKAGDSEFDFKEQMVVGDVGEKDFVRCYPNLTPQKSKNLAWDFNLNTGMTVELKTDDYPMSKTPNFFMETVSDTKSGKLGGPFRAFDDGVNFFVYYFLRDKTFFWFETDKLHAKLKELIETGQFPLKSVQNRNWVTQGYAIPRKLLESIIHHQDYFP